MSDSNAGGGWIGFLLFILFMWWVLPWDDTSYASNRWLMQAYYAASYSVPMEQVTIYPRPTDCDFLTAPLGSKGCSYKQSSRRGQTPAARIMTLAEGRSDDDKVVALRGGAS